MKKKCCSCIPRIYFCWLVPDWSTLVSDPVHRDTCIVKLDICVNSAASLYVETPIRLAYPPSIFLFLLLILIIALYKDDLQIPRIPYFVLLTEQVLHFWPITLYKYFTHNEGAQPSICRVYYGVPTFYTIILVMIGRNIYWMVFVFLWSDSAGSSASSQCKPIIHDGEMCACFSAIHAGGRCSEISHK